MELPVCCRDLLGYEDSFPLINELVKMIRYGRLYLQTTTRQKLYEGLKQIYVQLRSEDSEKSVAKNLYIDQVGLCTLAVRV